MGEVIRNLVKDLRETRAKLEDAEKTAKHWKKKCEEFKQTYLAIKKEMMCNNCIEEKQDGKTRVLCKDCSAKLNTKIELERQIDDLRQNAQRWKELYYLCRGEKRRAEQS